MTIRYSITCSVGTGYTVTVHGQVIGVYPTYRKANKAVRKATS